MSCRIKITCYVLIITVLVGETSIFIGCRKGFSLADSGYQPADNYSEEKVGNIGKDEAVLIAKKEFLKWRTTAELETYRIWVKKDNMMGEKWTVWFEPNDCNLSFGSECWANIDGKGNVNFVPGR